MSKSKLLIIRIVKMIAFGASVMCFQIEICFSESAPSAPLMEFHRGLSAVKFAECDGCDGAPIGIGLAVVSA